MAHIDNRLVNKNEGISEPEYRLPPTILGALIVPISLFGKSEFHSRYLDMRGHNTYDACANTCCTRFRLDVSWDLLAFVQRVIPSSNRALQHIFLCPLGGSDLLFGHFWLGQYFRLLRGVVRDLPWILQTRANMSAARSSWRQ